MRGIDAPKWFAMLLLAGYLALATWLSITSHQSAVRLDICTYALADERALRTEAGLLALFFSGYVIGNTRPIDATAMRVQLQRLMDVMDLHPDNANKLPTKGKADATETMITSGLLEAEIDHD